PSATAPAIGSLVRRQSSHPDRVLGDECRAFRSNHRCTVALPYNAHVTTFYASAVTRLRYDKAMLLPLIRFQLDWATADACGFSLPPTLGIRRSTVSYARCHRWRVP